jgi:hypothetical protein
MRVAKEGGPIYAYLTANRCEHCETVIEKLRGRWFHLSSLRSNCKFSEKVAKPRERI